MEFQFSYLVASCENLKPIQLMMTLCRSTLNVLTSSEFAMQQHGPSNRALSVAMECWLELLLSLC